MAVGDTGVVDLQQSVERVPHGWTRVSFQHRPYGMSRRDHVGGRVITLYAEQLDGPDRVSANVWVTSAGFELRPCEMPAAKVLAFLDGWLPAPT